MKPFNYNYHQFKFKFPENLKNLKIPQISRKQLLIFGFALFVSIALICLLVFAIKAYENDINYIQKRRIDSFNNDIKRLEIPNNQPATISKLTNIFQSPIKRYRELYKLYFKGVPDKYDREGNKIIGVEPNAIKAIQYLRLIIREPGSNSRDIINLAKIYHYGMHKFEPELNTAESIYHQILKKTNITNETKVTAQELITNVKELKAREWLNLPFERPEILTNDWHTLPNERRPVQRMNRHGFENAQEIFGNTLAEGLGWEEYIPELFGEPEIPRDTPEHNDTQNVHNPQVLSTIRDSIKKLQKNTPMNKNETQTMKEVKSYLKSLPQTNKTNDAIKSLSKLKSTALLSTGISEKNALNLVWNRIHAPVNAENKDNLKGNLLNELADMQEHGTTVCSTGRFTRIMDTLNLVDPEVNIRPTYAINEEMMNRAAKIRKEILEKEPDLERRKKLTEGTDPEQEKYDEEEKATILKTLRKEYADTGIMKPAKFEVEVGKWLEYI